MRSNQEHPLIMAHGYMKKDGQVLDNHIQIIEICNNLRPEIIELDLRKTKDNIIFCHHGKIPWGILKANFMKNKTLKEIKNQNQNIFTLQEILNKINYKPLLYLDIKDNSIKAKDLDNIIGNFNFKEIYIANYSKKDLLKFKDKATYDYKYAYQIPLFFLRVFLRKYSPRDINMIKVWRWNKHLIKKIQDRGFIVKLSTRFYSHKKFLSDSLKFKNTTRRKLNEH